MTSIELVMTIYFISLPALAYYVWMQLQMMNVLVKHIRDVIEGNLIFNLLDDTEKAIVINRLNNSGWLQLNKGNAEIRLNFTGVNR